MESQRPEPNQYVVEGRELPISSAALIELMRAVRDKGASFRFRAAGFSMSPFIKDGDVITVAPLKSGRPHTGDVVAFVHPVSSRLVVHRVVQKRDRGYVIKGDATGEADGLVPQDRLLAQVTAVERGGRHVRLGMGWERLLIALLTRTGLFLSLVIPLWLRVRSLFRRST